MGKQPRLRASFPVGTATKATTGFPSRWILLQFAQPGGEQRVVIELVRVRHRRDFFSQLGRAQRLGVPTILVLVGGPDKLFSLEHDIRALSALDVNIRVVPIALDDG
jgi:hypothetical protein